jgi:hypothetical protein
MSAASEGDMSVLGELQDQLAAYVEGCASLETLCTWLGSHVAAIYEADEPEAQAIADDAWLLLSEWDARERTEERVRAELRRFAYPGQISLPLTEPPLR